MISLVLEDLECRKADGKANYDFVVLQATDNSIPFYESMGFVRVGTVMRIDVERKQSTTETNGESDERALKESPSMTEIVSGDITTYTIQKAGESIYDIAKKVKADAWDIVFLNQHLANPITPTTKFYKGTSLYVPERKKLDGKVNGPAADESADFVWHIAKENDTPRTIAKKYNVNSLDVVLANNRRHPELISGSRLKEGTRIRVSHFHIPDNDYKPYSHWSFPDDDFEDGEPSYMMVKKLNRRKGQATSVRPYRDSLSANVGPGRLSWLHRDGCATGKAPACGLRGRSEPVLQSRRSAC